MSAWQIAEPKIGRHKNSNKVHLWSPLLSSSFSRNIFIIKANDICRMLVFLYKQ